MQRRVVWGSLGFVLVLGGVGAGMVRKLWIDAKGRVLKPATGIRHVPPAASTAHLVVAAHPVAADAGHEILSAGGSAIDAAVAVQAALTLVEPQSSGIGGGAFILYWNATTGELHAYDGRETAPAAATPALFQHEDGEAMSFVEAMVGGRSVGVPGVLRALDLAHRAHGRLPWKALFGPATRAAREGFVVTPRLHLLLTWDALLRTQPGPRAYFYQGGGSAAPEGYRLTNPALAETFDLIATTGADALYTGPIASDIVERVRQAKRPTVVEAALNYAAVWAGLEDGLGFEADEPNAGLLTMDDLAGYRAQARTPLCIRYKAYRVCGFPPPTSGGITTLQILGILSHFDLANHNPRSWQTAHLFAEASRRAFADREKYIADPEFVDVPTERLLSPVYLAKRASSIDLRGRQPTVEPGQWGDAAARYTPGRTLDLPSTSHFVVVDADGSIVSMTTSVENVFGSRLMVRGFILNNQLTDFSFRATRNGKPVANAVAPRKRPRSSMAPLIVFDGATGRPVLAVGSPGGSAIIPYTARAALGVLEWGLGPQQAVELPHVVNRGGTTQLESHGWKGMRDAVARALADRGHTVEISEQNSGLHAVHITAERLSAGIDPRREGAARGR